MRYKEIVLKKLEALSNSINGINSLLSQPNLTRQEFETWHELIKEKIAEAERSKGSAEEINQLKETLRTIPYKINDTPSNLKHRRRSDRYAHINIPHTALYKSKKPDVFTIYSDSKLGKIKALKPLGDIKSDFKIRWDRHLDVYHIITAEPIDETFKK